MSSKTTNKEYIALKEKFREMNKKIQYDNYFPFDQNVSSEFFDMEWMFGINDGFDVVIGNPPYLRIQGVKESNPDFIPYAKQHFISASKGNWDLYVLFTEQGYIFLKEKGILCYIQPHKFFQADFAQDIRNYISERKCIFKIVNFGAEQVFESATNYTCLFFLQKNKKDRFEFIDVEDTLSWIQNQKNYKFKNIIEQPNIGGKWNFNSNTKQNLLTKIKEGNKTLGDVTKKIFVGLQTSADKIYVLEVLKEKDDTYIVFSKSLEKEIEIEKGLVKPFLMGKDVKRYSEPKAKNVVIFPYLIDSDKPSLMTQDFIKNNFPKGWDYLLKNKEALGGRENGKMIGDKFYAYIYPKSLTEFQYPKIMTPDIVIKPEVTIDFEGYFYHTTTIYSFVFKNNLKEDKFYWLSLLNSKLFWFFMSETGNVLRGRYFRFKTEYLKPFPVKLIDFSKTSEKEFHEKITSLVDKILEKKKSGKNTQDLEDKIDNMVYKLYDLTYDEVKIVDPDFKLTKNEYYNTH